MLATALGTAARLVTDIPPDIWLVTADVSEFELALVNLALNARDAMPEGGVITISAANAPLAGDSATENLTGDFVALTVADTGCGIAPDIAAKVFEPFFTTKQGRHGTGLGLSQVHGFVHQSGGTVTLDSDLGKGTRITLCGRKPGPSTPGRRHRTKLPASAGRSSSRTTPMCSKSPWRCWSSSATRWRRWKTPRRRWRRSGSVNST